MTAQKKFKEILSKTRAAAQDYNMIEDGDKVCVGVSGGKDSLTLLKALARLRHFYPKKFELCAVSVDIGFGGKTADWTPIHKLCDELGVEYRVKETQIEEIVFEQRQEKNPCALCSKLRKGALNNTADELGANVIALGHNRDDANETLLLSLLYEGRLHCFRPVTYLSKSEHFVIRPMIYIPEHRIRSFAVSENLPVIKSECRMNGTSRRQTIKETIRSLKEISPDIDECISNALTRGTLEGWQKHTDRTAESAPDY